MPTEHVKSDVYLKVVLTVIAVCLVCLVARVFLGDAFVSSAQADQQPKVMDVRIVGCSTNNWFSLPVWLTANAAIHYEHTSSQDESLPVVVKNRHVDFNSMGIDETIPVRPYTNAAAGR